MAKKILIFSLNYYPRFYGGAEVAIKEITDRISPSEIEFHMVTLHFDSKLPGVEKLGNVLVHRIGFVRSNSTIADLKKFPLHYNKHWYQFFAAFHAMRLHRTYHYDGMWAMMAHSCGVPAALFKMFNQRVKYLLTLQEGDPLDYIEKTVRPLWPLFKRAFTTADAIQSISTFLGNWARRRGFTGLLEIIPNAVNTKLFSQAYSEEELKPIREMLGKKDGDVFLITTSRLVEKNAVDDVISALALLPANIHFAILGIGPDETKLRALADVKKVTSRVHFLGQVDHKEMPKYLRASDIFIRPSRSEGMGNSFVEAMAAELPVIATQEGGIADFLFDPELNRDKKPTGRAVPKDSPEAIARQTKAFITDRNLTKEIVTNAKELAFAKYDWDLIAKNMKSLFDKLLVLTK